MVHENSRKPHGRRIQDLVAGRRRILDLADAADPKPVNASQNHALIVAFPKTRPAISPGATEMRRSSMGNAQAILAVGSAKLGDQIPLLELQPDQDVDGGHDWNSRWPAVIRA